LWTLGLALPFGYVDQHPFDLTFKEVKHLFTIPDRRGANLTRLELKGKKSVRELAELPITEDSASDFAVSIDGIMLRRPIRFRDYPKTQALLQDPTLFVGKAAPDLSKIPESQRGGPLAFSCYFFFVPRVIPQEHNGILVRIHGASGTGFDSTFLKYQVAERQLGQLIAEVFIERGLEGALNIDRESFNTAHTHYQVLANWVHNAVRLIRNKLKELRSEKLKADRATKAVKSAITLASTTDELISAMTDSEPSEIPEVILVEDEDKLEAAIGDGKLAYLRSDVVSITGGSTDKELTRVTDQVSAVARLLEAHGLLQDLDNSTQAKLVAGIVKLFTVGK